METSARLAVRLLAEPDWFAAAERWRPGEAFPLVAGPAVQRYEQALGPVSLPPVEPLAWPGVVLSCGSRRSAILGELLAGATGRESRHVAAGDVSRALVDAGDSYVALVGLLADIDAIGDWPAPWHARVGVVTARDTASLVALIYRTLTAGAAARSGVARLIHPAMPGGSRADVTSIEEIDALVRPVNGLLLLNSHGRECCLHLPDGLVCGRSDAPADGPWLDKIPPAGVRTPSCLRGGGCFRPELSPAQRVPAHALRGMIVLAHACNAIALGVNALPHEVNVALGLLEGSAVAVLGPVGRHEPDPLTSELTMSGLARGLRPGDLLRELNDIGAGTTGELTRFGLLGDPALEVPAALVATAIEDLRIEDLRVAGGDRNDEPEPMAEIQTLSDEVLPAIESLPWFDVLVPEADLAAFGGRLRHLWNRHRAGGTPSDAAAAIATCRADLGILQGQIVKGLLATVHATWWQFGESAIGGLRQIAAVPAPCPHCGRASAQELEYRHGLRASATLRIHFCRRCGPVRWSTGAVPGLDQVTATDLVGYAGGSMAVPLTLRNNRPRAVSLRVGFAFANGGYYRLPPPLTWAVDLAPGEERVITAASRIGSPLVPDMFEGVFATCVDGRLTVLPTWVTVAAESSPHTPLRPDPQRS